LNPEQFAQAKEEPIALASPVDTKNELAPEVVTIARRMLHELEPERAALGGFTITTTIDPKLQAEARKAVLENLMAYDKRRGVVGPLKAPTLKEGQKAAKLSQWEKPFEGEPKYESHKVFVGVVEAANDEAGTFDVRIGTALGTVKLADYERYNPKKLPAREFAPVGARVRVSLLAAALPAPAGAPESKVPLRLELGPESAMVVMDVRSRNVLALVGNYEAATGGLDRATQSKRQPGSTFKPIVYSYALHSRRFTPASLLDINPQQFGTYKPSNYEGWTAKDPLRLREILAQSVNIGAVRVLDDVGPANVVSWAQALGITSHLGPDLSLALGSYEVEPFELCGAYATFAAGGMYEEPRIVTRIVGPDGKEIELPHAAPARRVLEDAEAFLITDMMTSVVDHGTATRAKALGRPVAGKTGTSNQSKDTWFAGY
ncbi:MAG: penicillin-binding protein, partial [Proteobacteria bacterium]